MGSVSTVFVYLSQNYCEFYNLEFGVLFNIQHRQNIFKTLLGPIGHVYITFMFYVFWYGRLMATDSLMASFLSLTLRQEEKQEYR